MPINYLIEQLKSKTVILKEKQKKNANFIFWIIIGIYFIELL